MSDNTVARELLDGLTSTAVDHGRHRAAAAVLALGPVLTPTLLIEAVVDLAARTPRPRANPTNGARVAAEQLVHTAEENSHDRQAIAEVVVGLDEATARAALVLLAEAVVHADAGLPDRRGRDRLALPAEQRSASRWIVDPPAALRASAGLPW